MTLPKAPTLPHNYTTIPSTLPPSCISTNSNDPQQQLAEYITSPSGSFRAHPSTLIAQNRSLLSQLSAQAREAEQKVKAWEEGIRDRDLAEKRRRAPGWLDSEAKILEPVHTVGGSQTGSGPVSAVALKPQKDLLGDEDVGENAATGDGDAAVSDLGSQMDKAFGGLG